MYFEFESDWFIAEFRRNDRLDVIGPCEEFLTDNNYKRPVLFLLKDFNIFKESLTQELTHKR